MKGKEALVYARQLLFEQRLVDAWQSAERIRLVTAIERWKAYPADGVVPRMDAERARWHEELEHEHMASLDRSRRDARLLEKCQARLEAAEGVVAQLRQDNAQMREELGQVRGLQEVSGELEQLRTERTARAAAGARAVLQEKALRRQLETEERRLVDGATQLEALEAMAEEDQAALRQRQAAEERVARARRDDAAAALRRVAGAFGKLAWRAAYAHARLLATWERHGRQLDDLEERLGMLHALRESRDALEWRVTQTKAALIVLRSAGSENVDPANAADEGRYEGMLLAMHAESPPHMPPPIMPPPQVSPPKMPPPDTPPPEMPPPTRPPPHAVLPPMMPPPSVPPPTMSLLGLPVE